MRDVRGRVRGPAIGAGVLLVALLVVPAAADPAVRPRIPIYDVVLALRADGVLHVRETITFDFADGGRGIVRRLRYRVGDRLYEVRDVRASSSTGAPARVRTTKLGHELRIGVGTRGPEVRGRQAYVIEYDVLRAFTPRAGFDELGWDAIGTGWDVPIEHAAVRVEAPVRLRDVRCRAGRPGASVGCAGDRDGRYAIDFTQDGLAAGEGMRVRVRLPDRAVTAPPPAYARPHWAGTWLGTAVLALAVAAAGLAVRRPPRRRSGTGLAAAGALLVAADAADDVVAGGPWAFSLGDASLAGLALLTVGVGIVFAHRVGEP
ncbi:DUF2207 domain-containing protein [Actinomadura rifamycini]|uniref:DUF2207 domain-containing protein n=1 Tax=Actinomadura rifamycini TaxID=31962 RepID=UPI00040EE042|nr:DUF2207 domain-containing protein [Actinomadura rifamycini]